MVERSILRVVEEPDWVPEPAEVEALQVEAREARGSRREEFIDRYIQEYRSIPDGQGRHTGFFRLGWRLHFAARVPLPDLESYLFASDYDRSRTAADVKSILKSLKSGRYTPAWYRSR
jgi:hypothetical protein